MSRPARSAPRAAFSRGFPWFGVWALTLPFIEHLRSANRHESEANFCLAARRTGSMSHTQYSYASRTRVPPEFLKGERKFGPVGTIAPHIHHSRNHAARPSSSQPAHQAVTVGSINEDASSTKMAVRGVVALESRAARRDTSWRRPSGQPTFYLISRVYNTAVAGHFSRWRALVHSKIPASRNVTHKTWPNALASGEA